MDPNANLAEQRRIFATLTDGTANDRIARLERLAELAQALDEWLSGGGFLPREWQRPEPVISGSDLRGIRFR